MQHKIHTLLSHQTNQLVKSVMVCFTTMWKHNKLSTTKLFSFEKLFYTIFEVDWNFYEGNQSIEVTF
jgi:hypothetical protein